MCGVSSVMLLQLAFLDWQLESGMLFESKLEAYLLAAASSGMQSVNGTSSTTHQLVVNFLSLNNFQGKND